MDAEGDPLPWDGETNVIFVDQLPKTSVGKFNKLALREQFTDYESP